MKTYFKELNTSGWSGKTIILDIDGTLTTDGNLDFDPLVLKKVEEMSKANSVFLFSNKHLTDRDSKASEALHVPLIKSSLKKPNKKVIDGLGDHLKKNFIVIGDKILIDGFFAKNIGAEFIMVERLTSKNDSLKTKLIYLLDDIAGILKIKSMIN